MTTRVKNPHAVKLGSLGGKAGTGKAKARCPRKMRLAALKSWKNRRAKSKA